MSHKRLAREEAINQSYAAEASKLIRIAQRCNCQGMSLEEARLSVRTEDEALQRIVDEQRRACMQDQSVGRNRNRSRGPNSGSSMG